jgi:branched-chain amino acid transport system permease protein
MLLQLIVAGLCLGSIYGMIALGYSLIYKASGLMNFTQGDLLTLGAFVGITFYKVLNIPFVLSLILTIVMMFFVGILLERGVIRVLRSKNSPVIFIVLATIAVSYIIRNGSQFIWGTRTLYFPPILPNMANINIMGVSFASELILGVILSAVGMFALHLFMTKTRFGTAMRSAALDPIAARSCGIDVSLTTGVTWGIAAGIAALGGMLIGPIYGVYTTLGATIGRKGFASAVTGGYGNMYGAIAGGLIIGIAETLISGYVSSKYKDMFTYGLLLLFLFIKPTGIFNERTIQE